MIEAIPRAFVAHSDRTTVLRLEGPLRYTTARALRKVVDDALARAPTELVILDLRATTFVDSTGLGLVARMGRLALARSGRRAVMVSPAKDVMTILLSAALNVLFVLVDEPPFGAPSELAEAPLGSENDQGDGSLGRVVLDAHRDLAALSAKNRAEYRDVISALEAELASARPTLGAT